MGLQTLITSTMIAVIGGKPNLAVNIEITHAPQMQRQAQGMKDKYTKELEEQIKLFYDIVTGKSKERIAIDDKLHELWGLIGSDVARRIRIVISLARPACELVIVMTPDGISTTSSVLYKGKDDKIDSKTRLYYEVQDKGAQDVYNFFMGDLSILVRLYLENVRSANSICIHDDHPTTFGKLTNGLVSSLLFRKG